jgi:serine/threonine-protein kinase
MPDRIDRYEIIEELGRGGMASVFYAEDPRFGRRVAIKLIAEDQSNNEGLRQRFEREARTIAALEHPAIVPVYDFGEYEGRMFLVMRHMPGGSLAERAGEDRLALGDVYQLMLRLAPAVDYAHSQGVVHRDLKPANILFDQHGKAYLADFGIARLATEGIATLTQGVIGTPTYMSPEQARGDKDIDGRSDVYSMGAMVFGLLNGSPPFRSTTPMGMALAHLNEPPPQLSKTSPQLPIGLDPILIKVLAKDRNDRYPTCSAFVAALRPNAEHAEAPTMSGMSKPIIPDSQDQQDTSPFGTVSPAPATEVQRAPVTGQTGPASAADAPTVLDSSPELKAPAAPVQQVRAPVAAPIAPAAEPVRGAAKKRSWLIPAAVALIAICAVVGGLAAASGMFSPAPETAVPTEPAAAPVVVPTDLPTATPTSEPTATSPPAATEVPTEAPTATESGPAAVIEDDFGLLRLIPAGTFQMGSETGGDETLVHTVSVSDFYIDELLVTDQEYAVFLNLLADPANVSSYYDAGDEDAKLFNNGGEWQLKISSEGDFPATEVTWAGAMAFCEARGGRLPTEAEWEKAARGGLEGQDFPWGNESPTCTEDSTAGAQHGSCGGLTARVGAFHSNLYGLFDMAGNVWEWVFDSFDANFYSSSPEDDPVNDSGTDPRVLRGGSYGDTPSTLRVWNRHSGNSTGSSANIGFRCVVQP